MLVTANAVLWFSSLPQFKSGKMLTEDDGLVA